MHEPSYDTIMLHCQWNMYIIRRYCIPLYIGRNDSTNGYIQDYLNNIGAEQGIICFINEHIHCKHMYHVLQIHNYLYVMMHIFRD